MPGPFLVIAPVTTLYHWEREFANWSDMNAVVFHGDRESRDRIRTYEFGCAPTVEFAAAPATAPSAAASHGAGADGAGEGGEGEHRV